MRLLRRRRARHARRHRAASGLRHGDRRHGALAVGRGHRRADLVAGAQDRPRGHPQRPRQRVRRQLRRDRLHLAGRRLRSARDAGPPGGRQARAAGAGTHPRVHQELVGLPQHQRLRRVRRPLLAGRAPQLRTGGELEHAAAGVARDRHRDRRLRRPDPRLGQAGRRPLGRSGVQRDVHVRDDDGRVHDDHHGHGSLVDVPGQARRAAGLLAVRGRRCRRAHQRHRGDRLGVDRADPGLVEQRRRRGRPTGGPRDHAGRAHHRHGRLRRLRDLPGHDRAADHPPGPGHRRARDVRAGREHRHGAAHQGPPDRAAHRSVERRPGRLRRRPGHRGGVRLERRAAAGAGAPGPAGRRGRPADGATDRRCLPSPDLPPPAGHDGRSRARARSQHRPAAVVLRLGRPDRPVVRAACRPQRHHRRPRAALGGPGRCRRPPAGRPGVLRPSLQPLAGDDVMHLRRAHARSTAGREADEGFALVTTVLTMALLAALSLVVLQQTITGTAAARKDQDWVSALGAAQAGLDDYLSRLNDTNGAYYVHDTGSPDAANPAMGTTAAGQPRWARVPTAAGEPARGSFHYDVDTTSFTGEGGAPQNGNIVVESTGRAGTRTRTLTASVRRSGFVDYVYFTDLETQDPLEYPVSASAPQLNRAQASTECVSYWGTRNAACAKREVDKKIRELQAQPDINIISQPRDGKLFLREAISHRKILSRRYLYWSWGNLFIFFATLAGTGWLLQTNSLIQ